MLVRGRLLIDPHRAPEPGVVVIDPDARGEPRIAEVRLGGAAGDETPDVGDAGCLIVPAFTDAHFHAPQIDSVGCDGMDLLTWLDRVIFPAEMWWGRGFAAESARRAARRLVEQGTAGVAAYLTSHAGPSREALGIWERIGLRFHAGRSAMDREAPDALIEEDRSRVRMTPAPSPLLPDSSAPGVDRPRANVSANPRFAVACSNELLAEIGWAVRRREEELGRGVFVQTHLAEMLPEVELIRALFPRAPHYTGVYDAAGLVGPRTLLAHCVHLGDAEWALLAERDAVAVHCPGANTFLQAGLFDLGAARRHGVRVALGSDVAAGPDVAMPRVARQMIEVAKVRAMAGLAGDDPVIPTPAEAWGLITSGNAAMLGWDDAGTLDAGARADLLCLRVPESWYDEHLVGRLIYGWDAALIESRVIAGRVVDPSTI